MATTQSIIDYYVDLLILQYKGKARAEATIESIVTPVIADQVYIAVRDGYEIDTAVGTQLDIVGKYVNLTRDGYLLDGTPYTMSDAEYRQLIKIAAALSRAGSSLYDIVDLLNTFFPGLILAFDSLDMRMDYYFDALIGSRDLAELFITKNLLPRPMGVALGGLIYAANLTGIFGFRTYTAAAANVSPFNSYIDFDTDTTFLSYTNQLVIP